MSDTPQTTGTNTDRGGGAAATTTVPELVGLPAAEAHDRALDAGLLAVGRNAVHTGAGRGPVADQEPGAGERSERGASVGIWIEGGATRPPGGSGPDDDGPDGPGNGGDGARPQPSPVGPAGAGHVE